MTTRREFIVEGIAATALALMLAAKQSPAPARGQSSPPLAGLAGLTRTFAAIEAESGGRLGVAVLDTGSGSSAGHRADERFPMCSTFKVLTAAAVLARVDAGQEQLERRISIGQKDILAYAPVTKQHIGGDLPVAALCEAMITLSDNTAANLLLESLGGPMAITAYARSLGDELTRLDRNEPDLNEAAPGDPRDTTTPAAMAKNLMVLSTGAALPVSSREQLNGWLTDCKTGGARIRAGLPGSWRVGDKTGSGGHGSSNDVAVIWPDGRPPIVIASYLTEAAGDNEKRNAVHAAVGRAVANALAG